MGINKPNWKELKVFDLFQFKIFSWVKVSDAKFIYNI